MFLLDLSEKWGRDETQGETDSKKDKDWKKNRRENNTLSGRAIVKHGTAFPVPHVGTRKPVQNTARTGVYALFSASNPHTAQPTHIAVLCFSSTALSYINYSATQIRR